MCRTLCDGLKDKDCKGPSAMLTRAICDTGCVLSDAQQACASEFAAAIACLSGLSGLCTEAFTQDDAAACHDAFSAADACDEAHQPPDDNQNASCSPAGGCACGDNACMTCTCEAGTDADAFAACLTDACAP